MGRKGNGYEDAGSRGGAVVTRRDQLERSERRVSRDLEQGGRRFLVERCREMTPLALVLIEDVMTGEGHETKDRLAAAKLVLEHGYGKPPSTRERPSPRSSCSGSASRRPRCSRPRSCRERS